jgi:hypothetical protein
MLKTTEEMLDYYEIYTLDSDGKDFVKEFEKDIQEIKQQTIESVIIKMAELIIKEKNRCGEANACQCWMELEDWLKQKFTKKEE